jgi:hypothetical protein
MGNHLKAKKRPQQRIKLGKDQYLHKAYRHIVEIMTPYKGKKGEDKVRSQRRYCFNLKEVKQAREAAPKGSVVFVFGLATNFREAWQA